ncbi:diguanylate cyclase, partial [Vibrio parahaemolyticus]|nr:diguanylate cyclase [Vibrio parahaemolyticus]
AKNWTNELWSTLKARPFGHKPAQEPVNITGAGPGPMRDSMEGQIISLTVPIFEKGVHQGVLSIDFDVDELLTTSEN